MSEEIAKELKSSKLYKKICYQYLNKKRMCENGSLCNYIHLTSNEFKVLDRYNKFECECVKYDEITKRLTSALGGCLMCKNKKYLSKEDLIKILDLRKCMCNCKEPKKFYFQYHTKKGGPCYICEKCNCITF
jgi:hypothetical protein